MNKAARTSHVPGPKTHFLLGNLPDIDTSKFVQSINELADKMRPIMLLDLPGHEVYFVSGAELMDELCDETRYNKIIHYPLRLLRTIGGDGLFTSWGHEPNWKKAHNILLPYFSQSAMKDYLPKMLDIAVELVQKWERLNSDEIIDVTADMTRLTLDTIGLCGFSYRFNSFYRQTPHEFIISMVRSLEYTLGKLRQPPLVSALRLISKAQNKKDNDNMFSLVDRLIQERKAGPDKDRKDDLLGMMLNGIDKNSNEGLDDINIRYQVITFLIAGHETTSGLLSFALYYLLKNPAVLAKAMDEVDQVFGTDPAQLPTYQQVHQLTYVKQVLSESLRLWPTAPTFAVYPLEDTVLANKYRIPKGSNISIAIPALHRDPKVWKDPLVFNPDRFSPENSKLLPVNAYKPFGNGMRACIGRQFALQEATLVLGMILQRFDLLDVFNYQLKIKETLTLKPENFKIKVRLRQNRSSAMGLNLGSGASAGQQNQPTTQSIKTGSVEPSKAPPVNHQTPLTVLYGSNLGSAEGIAGSIAQEGADRGFKTTIGPLNDYTEKLPLEGALIVVTASYNGTPPDNANEFCDWIKAARPGNVVLSNLKYTVFGCGNQDWASTYQAIPKLIDSKLSELGAERFKLLGDGNARDDFDSQYQEWHNSLWEEAAQSFKLAPEAVQIEQSDTDEPKLKIIPYSRQFEQKQSAHPGLSVLEVLENKELLVNSHDPYRSVRHIELKLPEGLHYQTGDHIGIIPSNGKAIIDRVINRFQLNPSDLIEIISTFRTSLPINTPITVYDLLADFVELQDVATRSQIKTLLHWTKNDDPGYDKLTAILSADLPSKSEPAAHTAVSNYREEILDKKLSLLDLLEIYPSIKLPFAVYLELLSPIRPRYYSIASSPVVDESICSITASILKGPARSGLGDFEGVCSHDLTLKKPGDKILGFVHKPNGPFRPPANPHLPLIMIGAGTGTAPYRGFLQDRAFMVKQGVKPRKSLLFFGCRNPSSDYLYQNDYESWQSEGFVEIIMAASRVEGQAKTYVQDQVVKNSDKVWEALEQEGIIYVCGDASRMAPAVRKTFIELYQAKTASGPEEAEQWLTGLVNSGRYVEDIWG